MMELKPSASFSLLAGNSPNKSPALVGEGRCCSAERNIAREVGILSHLLKRRRNGDSTGNRTRATSVKGFLVYRFCSGIMGQISLVLDLVLLSSKPPASRSSIPPLRGRALETDTHLLTPAPQSVFARPSLRPGCYAFHHTRSLTWGKDGP